MAEISDERLAQILASANSRASYEVCSYLDNAEMVRLITELQARRAADAKAVEALPPGLSKQDVVNLVDAAIQDSLVELDDLGGHRYDYDIMQEKLRANGLTIAALGARAAMEAA